jgi:hypothetical protein
MATAPCCPAQDWNAPSFSVHLQNSQSSCTLLKIDHMILSYKLYTGAQQVGLLTAGSRLLIVLFCKTNPTIVCFQ